MIFADKVVEKYREFKELNYGCPVSIGQWLQIDYANDFVKRVKRELSGEYKDYDKKFIYNKVEVSRMDFLDFFCPLDPTHTSDEEMLGIAKAIDEELVSQFGKDYVLDFDIESDIRAEFFRLLELAGLHFGMIYCEDFTE